MAPSIMNLGIALSCCFLFAPAFARLSTLRTRQAASDLTPIMFSDPILEPNILATFPEGTWIENLAVRSADGSFLATVLSAPQIYLLPSAGQPEPFLVAEFPGNLGVLGIVELGQDTFYAVVGNYSVTTGDNTPGSYSIWEVDLNGWAPGSHHHWSDYHKRTEPKTKQIAALPEAGLLNGLTVLDSAACTLLVADSVLGSVWSVNACTGSTALAIKDATMAPNPSIAGGLGLGINGLSARDGYLYYDNSDEVTFHRIPIDATTGAATGTAELLIDQDISNIFPDDFTLDAAGNAWLACEYGHIAFFEGVANGEKHNITAVAGNSTGFPHGFTAVQFGITEEDVGRGSLYVTTNGGVFSTGADVATQGQLLRYDTKVLGF